jgi:hypothetical protein
MIPSIDPRVFALAPDFRALSIVAEVSGALDAAVADATLAEAYQAVGQNEPAWAPEHLATWAQV